jgi:hypothetical protein
MLPPGGAIQVTGEEKHLAALLPWIPDEGECWVHATLHELVDTGPRTTKRVVLPPPGWYADPYSPMHWRWWDGSMWTAHQALR